MSESAPKNFEIDPSAETDPLTPETTQLKPEQTADATAAPEKNLKDIRASVNQEVAGQAEPEPLLPAQATPDQPPPNSELKATNLKQSLKHIQKQLPAAERTFSKVIHQPAVDRVSEVAAKTIVRPSAVLAGGIFALIGSSIYFYSSRHYHLGYNYLMLVIFFAAGFLVGLLAELVLRLVYRRRI